MSVIKQITMKTGGTVPVVLRTSSLEGRALRRYGGKGRTFLQYAPYIVTLAKKKNLHTFIDLFGGAGFMSLLAHNLCDDNGKPLFDRIIFNEIETGITRFLTVLQDPKQTAKLITNLSNLVVSKELFNQAKSTMNDTTNTDIEAATKTFIACYASQSSDNKNYRKPTDKSWQDSINKLATCPEVWRNIEIRNLDFKDMLLEASTIPDALLFADPPYLSITRSHGATDVYHHELDILENLYLISTLKAMGNFILCGYDITKHITSSNTDIAARAHVYNDLQKPSHSRQTGHIIKAAYKVNLGAFSQTAGNKKADPNKVETIWFKF